MFTCPRCNQALTRCQTHGGVYWRCPGCDGRTSTVDMLRQSADRELISKLWEEAQSEYAPSSLPCPACRASMKAVWLPPTAGNCQLDICLRCHVVWFDKAEYERLPTVAGGLPMYDKNLPMEARLALARLHVESLDPHPDVPLDTEPPSEDWKAIPAFFGMPVKHESSSGLLRAKGTLCLAIPAVALGLMGIYITPRMLQDFGFIPAQASRDGYLTVLTSLLLYGSLPHLATSIYFLLTFGDDLEELLGTSRFLLLVVGSGVCGNAVHAWIHPHSTVPLLGMGPAVSGILAAYGLRFPHARIGFIFRLPLVIYRWVNLPAWGYILFWIVTQAIGAAISVEGLQQVSWSAHLGGVIAGAALGALLGRGMEMPEPEE